ncbi:growth/differentiation factor 7 [Electrophorus electricus]|uniref:TGF-beta family profile domain-containing protein n=2 Tax=Electrophorus TaxID=8004 RepID=A0A4W4G6Q3_ELEEL|nr:growth/differentiation factor 7 [Electrophorus electricus]
MNPRKIASAILWFSFYFGNVLAAVVLGSLQSSSGAPDNGVESHLDAHSLGDLRAVSRNDPPWNGTSVHIPSYMISLYRTLSKLDRKGANNNVTRLRRHANTVTSFVEQEKGELSAEAKQRYVFDLSGLSRAEELTEVELRVLRRPPPDLRGLLTQGGSLYRLLLYSYSCPGSSHRPLLLTSRTVNVLDATSSTWEVFDVGAGVKAHRKVHRTDPGSTHVCFNIAAISNSTGEAVHPPLLGLGWESQMWHERALLVAFSHTRRKENLFREIREKMKALRGGNSPGPGLDRGGRPRNRRQRRTTLQAGRSGGGGAGGGVGGGGGGGTGSGGKGGGRRRTRCSRKPLHVNFKELGWDDWIIAPLEYEAYHCEGVCDFPLRSHLEPTNHAIIQTLMNSMDPETTPPSCCVPSKLSPISILYIDAGNNVVYKQYEDMVVESCGCR